LSFSDCNRHNFEAVQNPGLETASVRNLAGKKFFRSSRIQSGKTCCWSTPWRSTKTSSSSTL